MPTFVSFADALAAESIPRRRHLLLGNGFSIACRRDIFTYGALLDRAEFHGLRPEIRQSFEALDTRDFEVVMSTLENAATLIHLYAPEHADLGNQMREDARALREVLVNAIAQSHPEHPFEIDEGAYGAARRFLSQFGSIYTLSYDLLLYWAIMHEEVEPALEFDDGFRQPDDGPAEYVSWDIEKTDGQNVHYLHGALHLFDAGHELKKFTWSGTEVRLIDQVRAALDAGLFPLIVTEGESNKKLEQINHHTYLARSYRSFAKIGGALYVFGHSLAESDDHILRLIEKNKVRQLFVSVFGDPASIENQRIIGRAELLAERRPSARPLTVSFFDAEEAQVWG